MGNYDGLFQDTSSQPAYGWDQKTLRKVKSGADIEYMSPSSLSCFEKDRDDYVKRYFGRNRDPQSIAMAVGSAFDALVKTYLKPNDEELWASQVENMTTPAMYFETGLQPGDWGIPGLLVGERSLLNPLTGNLIGDDVPIAWSLGRAIWDWYKRTGGLALLLRGFGEEWSADDLICETTIEYKLDDMVIMGKPDLIYYDRAGEGDIPVILDWKVNGIVGSGRSPSPGYIWGIDSTGAKGAHGKVNTVLVGRHTIDGGDGCGGGDINGLPGGMSEWGDQIATYLQCKGETEGIGRIHQFTKGRPSKRLGGKSNICLTEYAWYISDTSNLIDRYRRMWAALKNDHIYPDLTLEESQRRVAMLIAASRDSDYNAVIG